MHITLIRHLPTEWNRQRLLQGKKNIPISTLSLPLQKEIRSNIHALRTKQEKFDLVLASTLIRTFQTARLYGYTPKKEPLLDELDFGSFEGKTKDELLRIHGHEWNYSPRQLTLGEKMTDFEDRIKTFLQKYRNDKRILAFGHGSWIRAFISYVEHGHINQMNQIQIKNNEMVSLFIAMDDLERRTVVDGSIDLRKLE